MFYSLPSRCPLNPFVRSLSRILLSLTFVQDSIFFSVSLIAGDSCVVVDIPGRPELSGHLFHLLVLIS